MPTEIRPTAVICSIRLVRLIAERKRSFWDWKIAQMTARPEEDPQGREVALQKATQYPRLRGDPLLRLDLGGVCGAGHELASSLPCRSSLRRR